MNGIVKKKVNEVNSLNEENETLKATLDYLKEELSRIKHPPLIVCEVLKVVNHKALIRLNNGNCFYVEVLNDIISKLNSGDLALAEQKSLMIVDKLDKSKKFNVENFVIIEKPKISWEDLGGLQKQIEEIKEVIELPIKNPKLFEQVGIQPPKGVLLYGVSGCGKTLLAKAVAASTQSTFIEVVGSELVQKFIGDGAKLIKDIFDLAREKAPSIVFIDELDAIAAERIDIGISGEREVQRTFMQLLSEMDGFQSLDNVKIIGATNRVDILDPAIIRPGRLDRLIEIPLPDAKGRHEIFNIHTKNMKLENDVNLKKVIEMMENFSGAEIRAVCTESGYCAIRKNRISVFMEDFLEAIKKISVDEVDEYIDMFG